MDIDLSFLGSASRVFRAPVARGIKSSQPIEREGGVYGSGLIRGVAVLTRGEAKGHQMWVDYVLLEQVTEAINTAKEGTKSRFTHPSLSGDGLGKALGRVRDASLDGDIVRGDLHIFSTAHETPSGDLAEYVMNLADEDPEAFGLSIAFDPDIAAEDLFVAKNENKDGAYRSPDPDNKENYIHARLAELEAADVVDSPAANPNGLFHRGDQIAFDMDRIAAFVLGLDNNQPDYESSIDMTRCRAFIARFLEARNLKIAQIVPSWRKAARDREIELDRDWK